MMKEIVIALLVISLMVCAGCTDSGDIEKVGGTSIVVPIDYGNGVLYFACTEARFGNSLSAYLGHNPSFEVVAITGDGNDNYGRDAGYFVVVKEQES